MILLSIVLNSIALALYDYTDRDSEFKWNQVIDMINIGFSCLYIFEAVAKIISYGFILTK
jgi:hypothetical protein